MAIYLVRHSGTYLKWAKEELQQMNQRIRKLINRYKALYSGGDIDILYVSSREGGRGFTSIEDSLNASIQPFEDSIKKRAKYIIYSNQKKNTVT